MQRARVVVTGIGMVTPLGIGAHANWISLLKGTSGVSALLPQHLPAEQHLAQDLASRVIGAVENDALDAAIDQLKIEPPINTRNVKFALVAAAEAMDQARFVPATEAERDEVGVCIGSAMSGSAVMTEGARHVWTGRLRRISPFTVPAALGNMAAGAVSMAHGFRGPNTCASTACATGSHALGEAVQLLRSRTCAAVLAGGSEACVDVLSIAAFARMRALSTGFNDRPAQASRPFDRQRDGFVLAEGAGVMLLETLEAALARGQTPLAEVIGFGASGDAFHISQPAPEGGGAALAMRRALRDGGVSPEHVVHVNAHASGTPVGDRRELAALRQVFGGRVDSGHNLHVVSTKGATGHMLGAAGAVEAAYAVLALRHLCSPPGINMREPDDPGMLSLVPHGPRPAHFATDGAAMCNSFGFGGTNSSVLFAPYRGCR
eukprot:jgi/Ulvmu1/276/UM001_0280.1